MMAPVRAALLAAPLAAAALLAACSRDAATPAGPTIGGAPRLSLTASADTGRASTPSPVTCTDSVAAGYGNECTGGICYEEFRYDPETGTEYVVTCDPDPAPYPWLTYDTLRSVDPKK